MRRFLFLLTVIFSTSLAQAQSFDMNERCTQAYQEIMKLRFSKGKALLEAEKKEKPGNRMPFLIENYIDFLTIYIGEDKVFFEQAGARKNSRMSSLKSGDKSSPYYLYSQAELHLQWAFSRLKFGEYMKAILEVRKAFGLLKENEAKFPQFKPNKKSLALLTTLFGAIPDQYKFGAKILGLKGDIAEGVKMMEGLITDKGFLFREETVILYTMLQLHLHKDDQSAWDMVERAGLPLGDNLLNHFIAASVALHTGKNDKAIQILSSRPSGKEYFPFPYLHAMLGQAKLNRLDKDAAQYLRRYLDEFKGMTYIKDAYRRLAWYWLVQDNPEQYTRYMRIVKGKGTLIVDEDKAAQKEAEREIIPDMGLLKARLLFDGAYYTRALQEMGGIKYNTLSAQEKAEFQYRKGRILHENGTIKEAILSYQQTIQTAGSQPWYFAPNACIKLGNIYERSGDKSNAELYYKKALTYSHHEYKNSIDAEAKAGLNRIQ